MDGHSRFRRFRADESGATAIEYALVAGIMSLVVIGVAATGGALQAVYNKVSNIALALSGNGG